MFVVLEKAPADREGIVRAARAVGLPEVDLRMRAQGVLPKVIHTDVDVERAGRLALALRENGADAFLLDALTVGQSTRMYARSLVWLADGFAAVDGLGVQHPCPYVAIRLVQKGRVVHTESSEVTRTEKKFSVGRAVLSGGLMLTKGVQKKELQTRENRVAMLLVQRKDGGGEIAIVEGHHDFRFLGAQMSPTSMVNLERTLGELRKRAPSLRYDDRAFRQAFLLGVPSAGVDQTELAFALVAAAV